MAEWNVPGYTELKELGSGGFGSVVLARHDASGTLVAIKYLRADLLTDPEFARMFRAEAGVLASLDDPNVVRLYEYVESPLGAAIVMEPVDGVSLREILLNQGATSAEAALVVLQGSLLGLAAAHRRGVVHRDYKPENVLVSGDGASKLTDFGIAARAGDRPMPAGTLAYAPPEQFAGSPATPASDVYAATATFYECLAGQPPFTGKTAEVLMYQHMAEPVPLDPVPEPLRPLVIAGMAKGPGDRPTDGTSFVNALRAIAAGTYGPDWERRGRLHLGEAALLLALLWPSSAGAGVHGSAAERVNLARHARASQPASRPASQPSAESRHIWHLRHLRHVLHLEHLRRRGLTPVKAVIATAAAIVVVSAGTALAVGLNGSSAANQHPLGSATPHQSVSPDATSSGSSTSPPPTGPTAPAAPPALTGISPASGGTGGGTKVVISGTGLGGATGVRFGGAAGKILLDSATRITVMSPAGKGTVNIVVTTMGGTSAAATVGRFTYEAANNQSPPPPAHPTVTGISPASGPAAGGTKVTISGSNLSGATGVGFGGAAGRIVFDSGSQITVTSPAGTAGTVNVTVTTKGGTSGAVHFTYVTPAPAVTGISPASGPAAGGTKVTISGTNLSGATGVSFGGTGASISADSGTRITATSPAGTAGTVNVTVTTTAGTSATSSADYFTYTVPAPTVTGVRPDGGPTEGGTTVTILGDNLENATSVRFGGVAATIVSDSDEVITVTSPSGEGTVDITVTTAGGTSATSAADHFIYSEPIQ
ncbi:MAG: IPT/TIG domain-containing protein [Streptosporangiaceae bacterium]